MNRETIVKNLNEWAAKLVAFDEAEKTEVCVWLLRDGKVEPLRIELPNHWEKFLKERGRYGFCNSDPLKNGGWLYAKDENITWFRSEEAALEAHSYKKLDDLISLREAIETVRQAAAGEVRAGWKEYPPKALATNTVEIAVDNLKELPRYPIPQGKMVPLGEVTAWLYRMGYGHQCAMTINKYFKD